MHPVIFSRPVPLTSPPAERHPVAVYLARLAPGSRRAQRGALETVAAILSNATAQALPWWELRYQHTQAVRAVLAVRYAPATANRILAALRGVLRECWRLGLVTADLYQRAVDLSPVRGHTLPAGRALSNGELRTLFQTIANKGGAGARRDAALLAVLYGGGLRRAEAVSLRSSDFNPETGALTVRRGKGHKSRVVYATNGAREALDAWIALRGDESGPLFLPVDKNGRIAFRRLTVDAVYDILRRLANRAGVAAFSPHDLRRTFISDLLDAGADIATVQRLAGHADVSTTARYDRRGEQAKQKAVELLHVPFVPVRGGA